MCDCSCWLSVGQVDVLWDDVPVHSICGARIPMPADNNAEHTVGLTCNRPLPEQLPSASKPDGLCWEMSPGDLH